MVSVFTANIQEKKRSTNFSTEGKRRLASRGIQIDRQFVANLLKNVKMKKGEGCKSLHLFRWEISPTTISSLQTALL